MACNTPIVPDEQATIPDKHTSKTALDWQGTYRGTVPCDDCEGVVTTLTLNEEGYEKTEEYLGKNATPNRTKGPFSWDDSENAIKLLGLDPQNGAIFYQVREGALLQLNREQAPITGANANLYLLLKQ